MIIYEVVVIIIIMTIMDLIITIVRVASVALLGISWVRCVSSPIVTTQIVEFMCHKFFYNGSLKAIALFSRSWVRCVSSPIVTAQIFELVCHKFFYNAVRVDRARPGQTANIHQFLSYIPLYDKAIHNSGIRGQTGAKPGPSRGQTGAKLWFSYISETNIKQVIAATPISVRT